MNNLRPDAGLVAQSNSDATAHRALSQRPMRPARLSEAHLARLEGADIRLLAEPGEPEFLLPQLFFLDQFLFDLRPELGEGRRIAAFLFFHLQNVKIRPELDHVADAARWQVEGPLLQFRRQRFALDPAPIAAVIARRIL